MKVCKEKFHDNSLLNYQDLISYLTRKFNFVYCRDKRQLKFQKDNLEIKLIYIHSTNDLTVNLKQDGDFILSLTFTKNSIVYIEVGHRRGNKKIYKTTIKSPLQAFKKTINTISKF